MAQVETAGKYPAAEEIVAEHGDDSRDRDYLCLATVTDDKPGSSGRDAAQDKNSPAPNIDANPTGRGTTEGQTQKDVPQGKGERLDKTNDRIGDPPAKTGLPDVKFDKSGRLTSITGSDGTSVGFNYDKDGKVTGQSIKDKDGKTLLTKDVAGAFTAMTYDKDGKVESKISFNKDGRATSITAANGESVDFKYGSDGTVQSKTFTNSDNRLDRVEYKTGNTATFEYDKTGQLTGATTRDADGRVLEKTDVQGNVTTMMYGADGKSTGNVTLDKTGKLQSMQDAQGNTTRFTYGKDGKPDGRVVTDAQGRVTALEMAGGAGTFNMYDGKGTKTGTLKTDASGYVTSATSTHQDSGLDRIQAQLDFDKSAIAIGRTIDANKGDLSKVTASDMHKFSQQAGKIFGDPTQAAADAINRNLLAQRSAHRVTTEAVKPGSDMTQFAPPKFGEKDIVGAARFRLQDAMGDYFKDAGSKDCFDKMQAGFEQRMNDSIERRTAAGEDKDAVTKEVQQKMAATYDHLTRMVTGEGVEQPRYTKQTRQQLAETMMFHMKEPDSINSGKMYTGAWLQPTYVTIGFGSHPDQMARILADASLTGQFKDTKGKTHSFNNAELSLLGRERGQGWSIDKADTNRTQPSSVAYLLDRTLSKTVGLHPYAGGTWDNIRDSIQAATGDKPKNSTGVLSKEAREDLVQHGGALRSMPGYFGTFSMRKEGDNWKISRADQYHFRDTPIGLVPAAGLAKWVATGEGMRPYPRK